MVLIAADAGGAGPDWAGLLEDLVLKFMEALEIPDLVRSGAVCASWHTVYLAFRRRRRLPLPISRKQLPCLLYACQDYAPDAAALCCPFTGDSVRVPLSSAPAHPPLHHRLGARLARHRRRGLQSPPP